jgi:ADP-ribose pyrophosphatase YjhB (NUDIX family)
MIYKCCPDCGSECERTSFKSFRCLHCSHKFYDEPVVAAGGLIKNQNNKYLFIRRNIEPGKGSISVPGGCVDNNESLENCFKRESFEETGVRITNIKYFSSYPTENDRDGQRETAISAFFTAETSDVGRSDKDEVSNVFWLGKNEIDINQITLPDVKAFIQAFLKKNYPQKSVK